jgi:hypothetical protein
MTVAKSIPGRYLTVELLYLCGRKDVLTVRTGGTYLDRVKACTYTSRMKASLLLDMFNKFQSL